MHSPLSVLIVLGMAWLGCYWISLHLHPFTKCQACDGTGRHRGLLYVRGSRACTACGGNSRVPRLGVRMFMNESSMRYRK